MSGILKYSLIIMAAAAVMLPAAVALPGCGSSSSTSAQTATTAPAGNVIGDRAQNVLASIASTGDYAGNMVTANVLQQNLSQVYVLDIRRKADYVKGHIPGAKQVEFSQWAAPQNLARLPKNQKIAVVCYTGSTAAEATAGLRMLGYDAVALKGGMNGWAPNETQSQVASELSNTNYPDVTTASPVSGLQAAPAAFRKPGVTDYRVLAEKANKVFSQMPTSGDFANNIVSAAGLSALLNDATKKDTVFVLDVRQKADFDRGHIAGAVNIDLNAVAVPGNLRQLPMNKKIVVVSHSGNTADQVVTVLRMLDFDAAGLKYGMMGWDGTGKTDYLKYIKAANRQVTTR
ncbi:MAG: rhodanese-like domain-containing protein [Thermoleophilia bacterium]